MSNEYPNYPSVSIQPNELKGSMLMWQSVWAADVPITQMSMSNMEWSGMGT
jgi:hypothetical protein